MTLIHELGHLLRRKINENQLVRKIFTPRLSKEITDDELKIFKREKEENVEEFKKSQDTKKA